MMFYSKHYISRLMLILLTNATNYNLFEMKMVHVDFHYDSLCRHSLAGNTYCNTCNSKVYY